MTEDCGNVALEGESRKHVGWDLTNTLTAVVHSCKCLGTLSCTAVRSSGPFYTARCCDWLMLYAFMGGKLILSDNKKKIGKKQTLMYSNVFLSYKHKNGNVS